MNSDEFTETGRIIITGGLLLVKNGLLSHVGKVVCVIPMIVICLLPHVDFRLNDHRKDAPHFTVLKDSENNTTVGSL